MTQNTHTPGPWRKVHDHPDPKTALSVGYIRPTEKYTGYQFDIATVYGCNGTYNGDMEPEANARLIAAAPELLEALEQLVIEYDEVDLAEAEPASLTAAVNSALATIAKAKETQ